MNLLIIPARIADRLRCPCCSSIHFRLIDSNVEVTTLDVEGYPMYTTEDNRSYIECVKCHSTFPYVGNGIDGYKIDDGSGITEPVFEQQSVEFNPFYKYSTYIERGIV